MANGPEIWRMVRVPDRVAKRLEAAREQVGAVPRSPRYAGPVPLWRVIEHALEAAARKRRRTK